MYRLIYPIVATFVVGCAILGAATLYTATVRDWHTFKREIEVFWAVVGTTIIILAAGALILLYGGM